MSSQSRALLPAASAANDTDATIEIAIVIHPERSVRSFVHSARSAAARGEMVGARVYVDEGMVVVLMSVSSCGADQ